MKIFPLLFCLVSFFAGFASAQTNPNPNCPNLNVSSGGIVKPGEPMLFTAQVEGYGTSGLSFDWSVSTGEILEGQGTTTIKVLKKKDNRENLTATVQVKGLPEGCGNTASETEPICNCIVPSVLFDEFSIPAPQIDKARLADFIIELQKNPNAQGYIIEYFKLNMPKKAIKQKLQKIADYLVKEMRFEKDRITIITSFDSSQNLTKFWIVPPVATTPQP